MWIARREERRRVRGALVAALASFAAAGAAAGQGGPAADAGDAGETGLLVATAAAADAGARVWSPAPELETTISLRVTGLVVRARIEQRFRNPASERVEARYLFPLPEGATVDRFEMAVGDRRVIGELREKEQARREYAAARASGRRAALAESRRPNVYSVALAGLDPGQEISVLLEYQELVRYDLGVFRLRVPLVVAPRYMPRAATLPLPATAEPVEVCAAPAAGPVRRPVRFGATIAAGVPLAAVESPSHALDARRDAAGLWSVRLLEDPVPADRDLELVWRPVRGQAPRLARFEEEVDGERYAALLLLPPAPQATSRRLSRELIVVLDTSGSMAGASLEQAKRAVALALSRLEPWDRFNLIRFASDAEALFPASVAADARALEMAGRFVSGLDADGGTEMLGALELALEGGDDPTLVRQVLFVTDGQVGNEQELFAALESWLGDRRLFPVGIGAAPNSFLLTRAAELGRGAFTFVGRVEEVEDKMAGLFAKLERPVLADLELTWDDAGVEAYPQRPGDLYVGEPLLVLARLGRPDAALRVEGRLADAPFAWEAPAVAPSPASGLARLWARRKIDALEAARREPGADRDALRAEIVGLALRHRLVTAHTSFLAVERRPSAAPGDPPARDVPTLTPAGSSGAELPQGGTRAPLELVAALALALSGLLLRRQAVGPA